MRIGFSRSALDRKTIGEDLLEDGFLQFTNA
jgi:hypothetical protein